MRTTTTDAAWTTAILLFVIALTVGNPTDTGADWIIRTICIYPFTHLLWRGVRYRDRMRRQR